MDGEDCAPFTDVYWIKFVQVNNARFAKRKLDESVFLGNKIQVSYAPQFEIPSDTKEKLECRRREVLARLNRRSKGSTAFNQELPFEPLVDPIPLPPTCVSKQINYKQRDYIDSRQTSHNINPPITTVSSNKDYFPSQSMNKTVQLVRQKLDKIQSSSAHLEAGPAVKKARVDNRRRI